MPATASPITPLLFAASAGVLCAGAARGAEPGRGEAVELGPVVVVGARASLATAQEIKEDKIEIVDSVVADDIVKLPDFSVTDALQRITGVQIARDRGEGAGVAIRGLTQMETTLNGREIFTAGNGRNLDFADLPAEMVAGIDVYKTASPDHIEGGVGGTIDLRTRRPFDFAGREIVGSARVIHGDLVDKSEAQFSTLLSNCWRTGGAGEFGLLLGLSHQKRAWREDQKSTGAPAARTDLVDGLAVTAPGGTSENTSVGTRERSAANAMLQWRPVEGVELYAEGSYAEFETLQDTHQLNASASSTFVPGSVALFPGTNDLKRITWTDAPVSILSFARDTLDRTSQGAVGGSWRSGRLTLAADLSYTGSYSDLLFSGPFLAGSAASFTHDLSTTVPGTRVGGTDLLDPKNLRYTGLAYRAREFDGDLAALRLDGAYRLDGFIHTVAGGVRIARRRADDGPGLIFGDVAVSGVGAADKPGFVQPNPYRDFFPGAGAPGIADHLVGNLDLARDPEKLREAFGITTPLPTAGSPLGVWKIEEDTRAAYVTARFGATRLPVDGNAGVRVVRTRESVSGARSVPDSGGVEPIAIDHRYTDYLPSLNLRYAAGNGLYLRAAASKTLTRPDFNQLSPSLTLIRNSIDPALNQGSAGNPELEPVRADNLDLAVEKYFGPATSAYVTLFAKSVDGFVTTVSRPETHDGATYQVSRPQNGARADIRGVELGYQQFFDFLPGRLSGLGVQANYTYIDSEMPAGTGGDTLPLQNLSKHSFNVVGMYEQGRISARVAYNWRDRFLSGISNVVGLGALPVYTDAYGWLDASLTYRVSRTLTLALEGTNLSGTVRNSYYGARTRPQSAWRNDTQIGATATIRF